MAGLVVRSAEAATPAAVLVLNANCADTACVVGEYGAGFIVKIDKSRNSAYLLTALHVVNGAGKIGILYDPAFFPRDHAYELAAGRVPQAIASALVSKGHPEPVSVRSGFSSDMGMLPDPEALFFLHEVFVLSGGDREYLVQPQAEHLVLYHLLRAVEVKRAPALDVALLAIEGFPNYQIEPVAYMAANDAVATGTDVSTLGCDCGPERGVSQADVRGTVVSGDPGFLTYDSPSVAPGFSGGPVLLGEHVVAMNLRENVETGQVRARSVSDFKQLVDDWIGLPRMKVELAIASPQGALDGIVSTDQTFTLTARASLHDEGQVLAPLASVHLDLPDNYGVDGDLVDALAIGGERSWIVASPAVVSPPDSIALRDTRSPGGAELAVVPIETEAGSLLKGVWLEKPRNGARLFLKDEFPVSVRFTQSGAPVGDRSGHVSLDYAGHQFSLVKGRSSADLEIDVPVRWTLKAIDVSIGAPISLETDLRNTDRNGKPIDIELPPPVRYRIKEDWKFRFYTGFGRLGLKDSTADSRIELELGIKFRIANVLQMGIPLRMAYCAGFGWDEFSDEHRGAVEGTSLVADLRYWGGAGLATKIGPLEACLDVGYIVLYHHVDSNIPDELRGQYERDSVKSLFVRPGVELGLAPMFAFYGGARFISDLDGAEYYLQLRIRQGR